MKHGLTIRGDSLYCPLPLSIEPYWWCEIDCFHCYFRGLNHIWGKDLRPLSPEALEKKLIQGMKNENPKSPMAWALKQKKTIRLGNKTDPFQYIEKKLLVSTNSIHVMRKLRWEFVIQTRLLGVMEEIAEKAIEKAHKLELVTIMPIISPGMEKDWETFERKRTTSIPERIRIIQKYIKKGIPLGVQGEPFIPGFHTLQDFEDTIKRLKSIGVNRYNTYNFHFTPFVAKRIAPLPGVDIERIWEKNQDGPWKKILSRLLQIAEKYNMILGCPDFVNSGKENIQTSNTCCGIDVKNPCTFNTHHFKQALQLGKNPKEIEKECWDGVGDFEQGLNVLYGRDSKMYTLKEAGWDL